MKLPPEQAAPYSHTEICQAWISHICPLHLHSRYQRDKHDHMFQDSTLNIGKNTSIANPA